MPVKKIQGMLLCAAAVAALALPAAAAASAGSLYGDYTKDGAIDGCSYSPAQLNGALGSIPTDVAQYDPGFKNALNKALTNSCGGGGGAGGAGGSVAQGKAGQAYDADGAPKPARTLATKAQLASQEDFSSDRGFPTALIVLAGMVAAILLVTSGLALARSGRLPGGRVGGSLSDYYWALRDRFGR